MKKLLSIILAVLMIVTSVPFAFAAETAVPDTVYFDNTSSAWSKVNAYFFDDSYQSVYNSWPGTQMAEVGDNIYSIEVPEGALYVVFNDNDANQTADLTIPTDGSNCYDNGSAEWTTFSSTAETDEALWGTADNLSFSGTLAEAFSAAEGNSEITYIKLNRDVVLTEEISLIGVSFTLDINGKTLSFDIDEGSIWAAPITVASGTTIVFDDTATEKGEIISPYAGISVAAGNALIKNISITGKSYGVVVSHDSTVEIDGATVTGTDYAGIITDGSVKVISGSVYGFDAVRLNYEDAQLTVIGGTLEGEQTDIYFGKGSVDLSELDNSEGITFHNYSGILNASSVLLPYDYHFYDAGGKYTSVLEDDATYTIKKHRKFCTSAVCEFCNEYLGVSEHADEDKNCLCDICDAFLGEEIKVGNTYVVEREVYVKFVPTVSGTYILSSSADSDPKVTLYSGNFEFIDKADDYEGLNFLLTYSYEAGKTYYFEFYDYAGAYNYNVTLACQEHQGTTQTCKGYVCDVCGEYFGEADENAHSFTDYEETEAPKCGVAGKEVASCDNGCGATDEREIPALEHKPLEAVKENEVAPQCEVEGSYDLVVYCDLCGDELDRDTVAVAVLGHNWIRNILVRPTQNIDGSWKDGYYYDKCKNDESHNVITGVAKRADYTAYDNAFAKLNEYRKSLEFTDAAEAELSKSLAQTTIVPNNLVEGESSIVFMNNWVKSAEAIIAKIESGEYVKADYTVIDEVIADIDTALETATISDEMKAELADIKADLEALKENANASMADVIELLDRAEAITETMNACANGAHSFTNYEETEAPKCGVAGKEVATCDNGCGATDENDIAALEHADANGDYFCDNDCGYEFEIPVADENVCEHCGNDHSNPIYRIFCAITQFFLRFFRLLGYWE